jgi:hypothetical protein
MNSIWAVIGGLLGVLILSFVMVVFMVTHPPRPAPHKTIPPPCKCGCIRKAGVQ